MEVIIFILVVLFCLIVGILLRREIMGLIIMVVRENSYKSGGKQRPTLRVKDITRHPRSRSEAEVVKYLEEITGTEFPSVYPGWLVWRGKTLELDGFNGEIALEFSGPLHTKWNPQYESYPVYFERLVRDVVKIRLCRKNKVPLIVVDFTVPSHHWRNYVLSRLYDLGKVPDRPSNYIYEQTAQPFRNEQLERELGLTADMEAALRLA